MRPWTATAGSSKAATAAKLQWGHGLAAVDGCEGQRRHEWMREELQWGHGLAAVDGAACRAEAAGAARASMGPRPCGRGRSTPPPAFPAQW